MDSLTVAYEWGLKWVEFHLEHKEDPTEDDIYLVTEQVMRDWDLQNPDVLTDEQWDDVCYCIRDHLTNFE